MVLRQVQPDNSSTSRKLATLFLVLAGAIEGYASVFTGTAVAQAEGGLRRQELLCILFIGVLGFAWFILASPSTNITATTRTSRLARLGLLLPAYAFCQIIPLPLNAVRILSPARAKLVENLAPLIPLPRWIPLSVTPSATLFHVLLIGACLIVFLVIFDLTGCFLDRPWPLLAPLIVIAFSQAVIGILQAGATPDGFATGTYTVRNHYAGFLEMILPFPALVPFIVLSARRTRSGAGARLNGAESVFLAIPAIAVGALILTAIVLSLSRMGFVTSLASLLFIAVIALSRGPMRRPYLLISGAAVAVTVLVLTLPTTRLLERFGEVEEHGNDRTPAWRDTLNLIDDYPVFGSGLGSYDSAFLKYKHSAPGNLQDYAHNDYLQYLAELGIVGFILGAIPLIIVVMRLTRGIRHPRPEISWLSLGCAGSLLAIGLHSILDFNLYVPCNMFTLAWILGIAASAGSWSASHPDECAPASVIVAPRRRRERGTESLSKGDERSFSEALPA